MKKQGNLYQLDIFGNKTSNKYQNQIINNIDFSTFKVKKGDIFQIGKYRIICGDSTDISNFEKLLDGKKIDLCFTSPPYNSGNTKSNLDYWGKEKKETFYLDENVDNLDKEEYLNMMIEVLKNIEIHCNNIHSVFINISYNANSRDDYGYIIFNDKNKLKVKETIVWDKLSGMNVAGDNILSRNSEFIFLMSSSEKYLSNQRKKGKNSIYWNIWKISNKNSQSEINKACFPLKLPEKAICDFSEKKHLIFDPFLGTGTTMIASELSGRICYGIEIEPEYVKYSIIRLLKTNENLKVQKIN